MPRRGGATSPTTRGCRSLPEAGLRWAGLARPPPCPLPAAALVDLRRVLSHVGLVLGSQTSGRSTSRRSTRAPTDRPTRPGDIPTLHPALGIACEGKCRPPCAACMRTASRRRARATGALRPPLRQKEGTRHPPHCGGNCGSAHSRRGCGRTGGTLWTGWRPLATSRRDRWWRQPLPVRRDRRPGARGPWRARMRLGPGEDPLHRALHRARDRRAVAQAQGRCRRELRGQRRAPPDCRLQGACSIGRCPRPSRSGCATTARTLTHSIPRRRPSGSVVPSTRGSARRLPRCPSTRRVRPPGGRPSPRGTELGNRSQGF